MQSAHHYQATIRWTGNTGKGTLSYRAYKRDYSISIKNKTGIQGSSDPKFLGDASKYNPEELLVASLSACHMLWYLHLCSKAGIIVMEYSDNATGEMAENRDGGGFFKEVNLNPVVIVKNKFSIELANQLHDQAHKMCFIANSVNFPVFHHPKAMLFEENRQE